MARTNPTSHPVRVTLEVVSNAVAFELLRAALAKPGSQRDLMAGRMISQSSASRALREMFLIGLLELDGRTYTVKEPAACREMLLGAGRARKAATDADRTALEELFRELEP